ncbi:MAG TPA: hypothetical protein VF263_13990 [Longimicrobiaceae bacterium]
MTPEHPHPAPQDVPASSAPPVFLIGLPRDWLAREARRTAFEHARLHPAPRRLP